MNKLLVVLGCSAALYGSYSHAEIDAWKIKPGLRALYYDDVGRSLEDEQVRGSLGLEYQKNHWGIELQYWQDDTKIDPTREEVDVQGGFLNGYFYVNPESKFTPYFVFGAGHADFDSSAYDAAETQANVGLGFQHKFHDNWAWWADIREVHGFDDSTNDTALGLGITFMFGDTGSSEPVAAVAAPVADTDGDGINDDLDQCPGSSPGARVDSRGCELDDDGDGVLNTQDQCPGTASGIGVDSTGCPMDSDGDGVIDSSDQCPDSEPGEMVDTVGCKVQSTRVEEIRLEVLFASGSTDLQSQYLPEVERLADFMNANPELNVVIEGHTDDTGPEALNERISKARADAVAAALISEFGIDEGRVSTEGYGESQPIANNDTAEGRRENRRVVAGLTKTVTE